MTQHPPPTDWIRPALPLLAGLICAQLLATLFVWQSNRLVLQQVQALTAAGWLAIPAGPAMAGLKTLGSALRGGVFYTLSVGAALTLLTWAGMRLWAGVFNRHRLALGVMGLLWLAVLGAVNFRGLVLYPSLLVFFTPLCTALAALWGAGPPADGADRWLWLVPVLLLVLLTGLWSTQLNANLFIAIRDNILLSNSAGRKINDFYYRNTLYAAQAFKSFNQKTIRIWQGQNLSDDRLTKHLDALLASRDILKVPAPGPADVTINQAKDKLLLKSASGDSLEVTRADFLRNPDRWLGAFSDRGDRYAPLRRLTLYSLLVAFPVLLYVLVYGLFYFAVRSLGTYRYAVLTASGLCLVIGISLFAAMLKGQPAVVSQADISSSLAAPDWPRRVAALRLIERQKIEIHQFTRFRRLLQSPLVVERYWLARALAVSRSAETYADLLAMTRDAHPNVICQAYFALGQRGDPAAIERIRIQMLQSDHWYTQWYGYNAMRKLGWRQRPLK